MVRISLLSDLHLERSPYPHALPPADVHVFAGDIDLKGRGVPWIVEHTAGVPAIYVPGNHEPYGGRLPSNTAKLKALAAGTNVHVLDRDTVVIEGIRFLGATLWTDFALLGASPAEVASTMAMAGDRERGMSDYRKITFESEGRFRALIPRNTLLWHTISLRWLLERLAEPHDGPTIIVTHHSPSNLGNRPGDRRTDRFAPCYASNLDAVVAGSGSAFWFHGHTHWAHDTRLGNTRLISNARGYEDLATSDPDERTGYDPGLVVEVPFF